MQSSYSTTNYFFALNTTDTTVNNDWATGQYSTNMKYALRKGSYSHLNVYFLSDYQEALGKCTFPLDPAPNSNDVVNDGCIALADTLPGSTRIHYNNGGTVVHEVRQSLYGAKSSLSRTNASILIGRSLVWARPPLQLRCKLLTK